MYNSLSEIIKEIFLFLDIKIVNSRNIESELKKNIYHALSSDIILRNSFIDESNGNSSIIISDELKNLQDSKYDYKIYIGNENSFKESSDPNFKVVHVENSPIDCIINELHFLLKDIKINISEYKLAKFIQLERDNKMILINPDFKDPLFIDSGITELKSVLKLLKDNNIDELESLDEIDLILYVLICYKILINEYSLIEPKQNFENDEDNLDKQKKTEHLILILSYDCNLDCSYCMNNSDDKIVDFSTLKKAILDKYNKLQLDNSKDLKLEIVFLGGEPLLFYSLIKRVLDWCDRFFDNKNVKLDYSISTNLILLNNEILQTLKKYNFLVQTSLDGDEKTHMHNRVGKNNTSNYYDLLISNINLLKKNNIEVVINAVITKHNQSEVFNVAKHIHALGVSSFKLSLFEIKLDNKRHMNKEYLLETLPDLDIVLDQYKKIFNNSCLKQYTELLLNNFYDALLSNANKIDVCTSRIDDYAVVLPDGKCLLCTGITDKKYYINDLKMNQKKEDHLVEIKGMASLGCIFDPKEICLWRNYCNLVCSVHLGHFIYLADSMDKELKIIIQNYLKKTICYFRKFLYNEALWKLFNDRRSVNK